MYQDLIATFSGRASQKFYKNSTEDNNAGVTRLSFADFLLVVCPSERINLNEEIFFKNKFPVYDHQFLAKNQVSYDTKALMAELFATYIQFFMEREITLHRLYERFPDFQPSDMFYDIYA